MAAILQLIDEVTTVVALDDAIDHIACAEVSQVDVLLTTDDRLLRRAKRHQDRIKVVVNNPVTWLMAVLQKEGNDDDTK